MGYVVLTLSVNEASKDDFNPHSAGFIFFSSAAGSMSSNTFQCLH